MTVSYPAVNLVGGLLSYGLLQRIGDGDPDVPGTDPRSYELTSGESVRRLANQKYLYLRDVYRDFARQRRRASQAVAARLTRDHWLAVLLRELRYDGYEPLPHGITANDRPFPVTHRWARTVPMHLLPWEFDLDSRAGRGTGPAGAPPQAMVQQLLNQTDQHLWALLSNGHHLRLLRDSTSLVGSAYLEFNLESIFEDELFPDFVLLFRIAHATRLQVRDQETGPASCLLEQWRTYGAEQGERALNRLRLGVEAAIEILGTGFLDHPANARLREAIGQQWSLTDFKRALFRLIYRILFWMVIEDRNALFDPAADDAIRDRYATYFSSRRLRRLAVARSHSRHCDLWHGVRLIFTVLGSEQGSPALGLPGLGGIFEHTALDEPLHLAQLTNTALLKAVEALSILAPQRGRRQPVDFRHLGADELGGLYDALLELQPRWDPAGRHFHLERLAGSERKMTGSYYTPPSRTCSA